MFLRFKKTWSVFFIIIVFMLLLIVVEIYRESEIKSFEDCVSAGYPVMESYPRKCMVNDEIFVEDIGMTLCTDEDRNIDACIEIHRPVCGHPVEKTFSNSCFACINRTIDYYIMGECK